MKKNILSTPSIALIGMFTAVIAVLSILQIPMPSGVPITLQTFAVALCGYVLGRGRGTLSVALYLFLGFVGVPVFTGMTGGIGRLFGYTGGFLYGFLFLSFLCGAGIQTKSRTAALSFGIAGLLACHALGFLHYALVAGSGLLQAFLIVSLPYLPKDILSVIGAYLASLALRRSLGQIWDITAF